MRFAYLLTHPAARRSDTTPDAFGVTLGKNAGKRVPARQAQADRRWDSPSAHEEQRRQALAQRSTG